MDISGIAKFLDVELFCQRGANVKSLHHFIEDVPISQDPDVVFIHVGTNTLGCQVPERTIRELSHLITTIRLKYGKARIIVNNVLNRYDCIDLNDAATYLNHRCRNLCGQLDVHFAEAGANFPPHLYAQFDGYFDVHLNRDGYFVFAEEVVEEISRCSQEQHHTTFMPPHMIPPLVKIKTKKEKARAQREYLHRSAELCKFTKPRRKLISPPASSSSSPGPERCVLVKPNHRDSGEVVPFRSILDYMLQSCQSRCSSQLCHCHVVLSHTYNTNKRVGRYASRNRSLLHLLLRSGRSLIGEHHVVYEKSFSCCSRNWT